MQGETPLSANLSCVTSDTIKQDTAIFKALAEAPGCMIDTDVASKHPLLGLCKVCFLVSGCRMQGFLC